MHGPFLLQMFLATPQGLADMGCEGLTLSCVEPVFQRVLITHRRAGSRGTAMHTAAGLALNGWRHAGRAFAGLRPTPKALSHGMRVSRVIHGSGWPRRTFFFFVCPITRNRCRRAVRMVSGLRSESAARAKPRLTVRSRKKIAVLAWSVSVLPERNGQL